MTEIQMNGHAPRRGDWMQTHCGIQFWPLDPRPDEISIHDIAHALSLTCRYNGHCRRFYSVAEHSFILSAFATPEHQLTALLHDAAEAYLSDVVRPVKPFLHNYKEIENHLNACIAARFGTIFPFPLEVIELDNRILAEEKEQLMGDPPADWGLTLPPLDCHLPCYHPLEAEQVFLSTFHRLTKRAV